MRPANVVGLEVFEEVVERRKPVLEGLKFSNDLVHLVKRFFR